MEIDDTGTQFSHKVKEKIKAPDVIKYFNIFQIVIRYRAARK